jgi:RNA-directed DNA polymerase
VAQGITYTRWADDLFFSTIYPDILKDYPEKTESILKALAFPSSLELNRSKIRHSSKKGRRQVTGLVITSDKRVAIGRHRKRFIRRQLHRFAALTEPEREELAGLLAFAIDIEPDFLNALIIKYGRDLLQRARQPAR